MTILNRIVAHKRVEVAENQKKTPIPGGETFKRSDIRRFEEALRQGDGVSVIAEYKKASPSKGLIRADLSPTEVAESYEANGASAISVLTDERFFQGHTDYLTEIHARVSIPTLRKDFIIDPYQIREAFVIGADAILLITAILSEAELVLFQKAAKEYALTCLVEVHTDDELEKALRAEAGIIGINNRNLEDFSVDLETSLRLKRDIPSGVLTVSESGIHTREDVLRLQDAGFDAILVGESLMRAGDIGAKLRELSGQ